MTSSLFYQHLCIAMNKQLTFMEKTCRKAEHLSPVRSLCTNDHVPVNPRTMNFCLSIAGPSSSALCSNLIAASELNNPTE